MQKKGYLHFVDAGKNIINNCIPHNGAYTPLVPVVLILQCFEFANDFYLLYVYIYFLIFDFILYCDTCHNMINTDITH
jgi:hypothetical protein